MVQSERWSPAGMLNTNQTPALPYGPRNYISTPPCGLQVPVRPGLCPPSTLIRLHCLLQWMTLCLRNMPSSVLEKPLPLLLTRRALVSRCKFDSGLWKAFSNFSAEEAPRPHTTRHPCYSLSPVALQSVIHINGL